MQVGLLVQIILIIISMIIVIIVLLQGGKAQGLGGTLTGTSDSNLFQNSKESIPEKKTNQITFYLGMLFLLFTFVVSICLAFSIISI